MSNASHRRAPAVELRASSKLVRYVSRNDSERRGVFSTPTGHARIVKIHRSSSFSRDQSTSTLKIQREFSTSLRRESLAHRSPLSPHLFYSPKSEKNAAVSRTRVVREFARERHLTPICVSLSRNSVVSSAIWTIDGSNDSHNVWLFRTRSIVLARDLFT